MFRLFYVGDPLLDITTSCDANFLKKYNLKADDCILSKKDGLHAELFAEVFKDKSSEFIAGGSAQNSAKISKWVLKNESRAEVYFAGSVGNDEYATALKNVLQEENGVVACYTTREDFPTGVCVCLVVNDKERQRSMITSLGAAATYDSNDLKTPETRIAMEKADLIYTTGYCFSHSQDAVEYLASYCHENSKLFAISLSAPYVCEFHYKILLKWLPYVDIVFGNFEEAKIFVDKLSTTVPSEIDAGICAQLIANYPRMNSDKSRVVIISNGSKPVSVCSSNCKPEGFEVPKLCNLVDTIGCGDALTGGFLASYLVNKCIKKATKTGIICALEIAKRRGCTIPNFTFDSIETKFCC